MKLPAHVTGVTFDAGPLIALERGSRRVREVLAAAQVRNWPIFVPAGALGQAWRGGSRQAPLARFLTTSNVKVVALDQKAARSAGELCGEVGHPDLIDASVALCASRYNHAVVTSDPGDLVKLAPRLPIIAV